MKYWLMKTEPDTFSIDTLAALSKQTSMWEGVRNYQARNFLRAMKKGDLAFFYHSSCKQPGIAGIVEVVKEAYPDPTAFDPTSIYYDFKSKPSNPIWVVVDVKLIQKFPQIVGLHELRNMPELDEMILLKKGNRLSVIPVSEREWNIILNEIAR